MVSLSNNLPPALSKTVSFIVDNLEIVGPTLGRMPVHGAHLTVSGVIRRMGADPRIDHVEIFVQPGQMTDRQALAAAAIHILPEERRGKGVLSFYPIHFLPDVWSDGRPRILFSMDLAWLTRDRYLRDTFATGPTPIFCYAHALGLNSLQSKLAALAAAPPVSFDALTCLSRAGRIAVEKMFENFDGSEAQPFRLAEWHLGVDTDEFRPATAAEKSAARSEIGWDQDATIVLYLGRVTPYGKADLLPLIRAFARVAKDRPNAMLVIAGESSPPAYVKMLLWTATALGVGDRVISTGAIAPDRRARYFSAADVFVFPADSLQDLFPGTVIEAMAAGLPVIASDWDGLRDPVVNGETGMLLPTYLMPPSGRLAALSPVTSVPAEYLLLSQQVFIPPSAIEHALATLLDDVELRHRMGDAGRERAEREYSVAVTLDRWHSMVDDMLAVASQETDEKGRERRAWAAKLGFPTRYTHLFAHYASSLCHNDDVITLTELGRDAYEGTAVVNFYDETAPIIRQPILQAILVEMTIAGEAGASLSALTTGAAARSQADEDDVRMHIALLLKQNALDLRPFQGRETAVPQPPS